MKKKIYTFFLACFIMNFTVHSLKAQNVGIGTATPNAKLEVYGTSTNTTEPQLRLFNPNNAANEAAGIRLRTGGGWDLKLQMVQAVDWFQLTDATGVVQHSFFGNRFFPGASSANNTNTGYITGNGTRIGIGSTLLAGRVFIDGEAVNNSIGAHIVSNNSAAYLTNTTNGGGLFVTSANNGVAIVGGHYNGTDAARQGQIGGRFTSNPAHGFGVYGQSSSNNFGYIGYRDADLHIGAYGESDYSAASTNPAVSFGMLGVRDIPNNRSFGVYGYAPTVSTSSTWTDDFETDLGWAYFGGANRGAPNVTVCPGCSNCTSCLSGPALSGTNVLNLKSCANNGSSYATINLFLTAPGTFSGYYKIGSESGWDFLVYSIDAAPARTVNQISSGCNNTWTFFSFTVPAGAHTITLAYMTDGSIINHQSGVFIDNVQCTNVGNFIHYAGFFDGPTRVTGNLQKGSGSFLIDHPDDPENKLLKHDFVESPYALNLYPGKVKLNEQGQATIQLPSYYKGLNKEDEAIVTLTPIGKKPFLASYEWNEDYTSFTIYGEPNQEVAYQVIAERDDPTYRFLKQPVEQIKGPYNGTKPGTYLLPQAYGVKVDKETTNSTSTIETATVQIPSLKPLFQPVQHKPVETDLIKIEK